MCTHIPIDFDSRCRIFTTYWYGGEVHYVVFPYNALLTGQVRTSDVYMDILLIILNHYFSAWGILDDAHVRKGPIS
jgi:hypothetical protein